MSAQPATTLAVPHPDAGADTGTDVLVFRVAGERYGLRLDEIEQVVAMVAVSPLPDSPDVVTGVMNLRGRLLPVLDLRRRLGMSPHRYGTGARLVIARAGNRDIALLADEVIDIDRTCVDDVTVPETVLADGGAVSGLVALPDGLMFIVDLAEFLTVAEAGRLDDALERVGG